jgi:hypothetical protein
MKNLQLISTTMAVSFLYCETSSELQTNLNKIIEENSWSDKTALYSKPLDSKNKFDWYDFNTTKKIEEADFLFTNL